MDGPGYDGITEKPYHVLPVLLLGIELIAFLFCRRKKMSIKSIGSTK